MRSVSALGTMATCWNWVFFTMIIRPLGSQKKTHMMICDDGDVFWLQLYGESSVLSGMDDNSVLSGMDDNFILYLQAMRTKFTLFPLTVSSTSRLPPSGALK